MIVQSSHSPRQAGCASGAGAVLRVVCKNRRMVKQHPIRPHLRTWRLHKGWSQERLAEAVDVSHSTIQRQEAGKSGVDDKTFAAIAAAYGISVAELSADPSEQDKAKELARLLTTVRDLDTKGIRTLADLAEQLPRS